MDYSEYLKFLEEEIGASVFSSVDSEGKVHSRIINVGVGNEQGVFFMTAPTTNFYQQLQDNSNVAVTGQINDDDGFRVIRLTGQVRELGKEKLEEILKDNPYAQDVYPDEEERASVQAFQIYKGEGNYHHLQKQEKEDFSWDVE